MKMAMKDGEVLIKEANSTQYQIIKSWNKMKWDKKSQLLRGRVERELLNQLADLVSLPAPIEDERLRLNQIMAAVDRERMNPDPAPLIPPPIKGTLFRHQVRGYNMALLALGLVDVKKEA